MQTPSAAPYGTTGTYGIEEVPGRFKPATGKRAPSYFNVYLIATGKDVRHGLASRAMAEAAITALETAPDEPEPTPTHDAPTGWSKAARARTGASDASDHPLGELIERSGGRSIYRDYATGGRVEIWDNE